MSDLDEILESGDDEAIAAALEEMEATGESLFGNDDDEQEEQDASTDDNEQQSEAVEHQPENNDQEDNSSETDVAETESSPVQEKSEEKLPIQTKSGDGTIPYGVLTAAREETKLAREATAAAEAKAEEARLEAERLRQQNNDSEQLKSVYSKQLEDAGIELGLTPKQMLEDPKVLEQIKADYPVLGDVIAAIAEKSQVAEQPPEQQETTESTQETGPDEETQAAFDNSKHLKSWLDNDVDRWQLAQTVDQRLANDPAFANSSKAERFAEVEKRVMLAFGDDIAENTNVTKAPTEAPEQQIKAPIPTSPSDIGHQGSDVSPNTQLLSKGVEEMTSAFETMSEADIESALEQASEFL